jgi:hypothetical protein
MNKQVAVDWCLDDLANVVKFGELMSSSGFERMRSQGVGELILDLCKELETTRCDRDEALEAYRMCHTRWKEEHK